MEHEMIRECIYKTVGDCDIFLDVHLSDTPQTHSLPVILWFHGGGLLQGTRKAVPPHLIRGAQAQEYCLVCADYRLAPQVSVSDVLEDALDALRFVRRQLSFRLDTGVIHANDIAVSGSSAGGYLALLLALRDPKIRSCLAIYPITDPLGEFFTNSQWTPPYQDQVVQPYLKKNASVMSCNEPSSPRNKMYFHMMASANLAQLLHLKESQNGDLNKFIIALEIAALPKDQKVCPIYIVHGNKDKFVGVEQAYMARDALKQKDLEHVFDEIDGVDHLWDMDAQVTLDNMYAFARSHWQHRIPQKQQDTPSATTSTQRDTLHKSDSLTSLRSTTSQSTHHSIDTTTSASSSSSSSTGSDDSSDAQDQWAAQVHEFSLILNLIFLPLAGKYFGRQFAFWGWTKFMTWRESYTVVRDKAMQRLSSVVVAGMT